MLSNQLVPGMRVLHDNVGIAKSVFDLINLIDDGKWLVLFTDNTYAIVPDAFLWKVFE